MVSKEEEDGNVTNATSATNGPADDWRGLVRVAWATVSVGVLLALLLFAFVDITRRAKLKVQHCCTFAQTALQ